MGDSTMFSKNSDHLECFIGPESSFQGEFVVKGMLRIDGLVQGRVNADSVLLGKSGVVKGEVKAQKIIVGGKVEGSLWSEGVVEINATGKVQGDIFTNKLSVTEGGEFNGRIEMKMGESKASDMDTGKQEGPIFLSQTTT